MRDFLVVIGALLVVAAIAVGATSATAGNVSSLLVQVGIPVALAIIGLALSPVRRQLETSFQTVLDQLSPRSCRIFVYGLTRTGKSTLIQRLVALDRRKREPETKDVRFYSLSAPLTLEGGKTIKIRIADYRGQAPERVIVNSHPGFFGPEGARRIDVIIFVVDLFPELKDPETTEVLDDPELLEASRPDTSRFIARRVAENLEYLTPAVVRMVFERALNPERNTAVVLLINKIDLLASAVEQGFLRLEAGVSAEDYAYSQYSHLSDQIRLFCKDNGIEENYRSMCVSASQNLNTRDLFAEVFESYLARRNS